LFAVTGCRTTTGKTFGENVDDTKVLAEVKTKLAAERLSNLTRVSVDVVRGVVYLSGIVPTAQDRVAAERIARSVSGVQNVVDNLTVETAATAPPPVAGAASPTTTGVMGRHSVIGDVTKIDHRTGMLTVRTGEGDLDLRFPPASVQSLKPGDRIRVELGFQAITR
jgi:hypothetical protein